MALIQKTLTPGFLDAALRRIPHLQPFPVFHLKQLQEEEWLGKDDDGAGLELAEFDFDDITILY